MEIALLNATIKDFSTAYFAEINLVNNKILDIQQLFILLSTGKAL
jgi:hypothetical protein